MLKSDETLIKRVSGPLGDLCGPEARLISVEIQGKEVRGLALCPGRVITYVLEARSNRLLVSEMLFVADSR